MTTRCREFIAAEKQAGGNVAKACDLLEVSRSAFYDWHERPPSARALSDAELTEKIRAVHAGQPRGPTGRPGCTPSWPPRASTWAASEWHGSWWRPAWRDGAGAAPVAPPLPTPRPGR